MSPMSCVLASLGHCLAYVKNWGRSTPWALGKTKSPWTKSYRTESPLIKPYLEQNPPTMIERRRPSKIMKMYVLLVLQVVILDGEFLWAKIWSSEKVDFEWVRVHLYNFVDSRPELPTFLSNAGGIVLDHALFSFRHADLFRRYSRSKS